MGQILVKNLPPGNPKDRNTKTPVSQFMDHPSHGIKTTVIDLGLSRMNAGDGAQGVKVHWTPFDEEIFEGKGDYQFDVYRMMKEANNDDWEVFTPTTNVMVSFSCMLLLEFTDFVAHSGCITFLSNSFDLRG